MAAVTLDTRPSGQVTGRQLRGHSRLTRRVLRNLSLPPRQTSLVTMWPHSLLFSSDEEASRALSHAFRDLEFEVETCPEIFSAVERITSRSFDVVVSDWNEGLEAVFLLKTVRELQSNHSAFTLVIADTEAAVAALAAGADLVLSRPLVPDEIKYSLLTCDSFLVHMQSWLPRRGPSPAGGPIASQAASKPQNNALDNKSSGSKNWESRAFDSLARFRAWPSPPPPRRKESAAPVVAAESIFDEDLMF